MGGGGFPPTKLPQYPRHENAENLPASPSSLPFLSPLIPDSPQPGSSTVLPRSERPTGTSAVHHLRARLPNAIYPLPLAHIISSSALSSTQAPSTPCTTYNAPVAYAAPGSKGSFLSTVSCTPPPTVSPTLDMVSRPF